MTSLWNSSSSDGEQDLPELRLSDVLRNKTCVPVGRNCFRAFLEHNHSLENMTFWYVRMLNALVA